MPISGARSRPARRQAASAIAVPVVVATTTSTSRSAGSSARVSRSTAADACGGRPLEPRLPIDEPAGEAARGRIRIDLEVPDVVADPLQLDPAEQELRRPLARPRGVEPRQPAGVVDEGDPHRGRRLPSSTLPGDAPAAHEALEARQPGRVGGRAARHRRDVRAARAPARQPPGAPAILVRVTAARRDQRGLVEALERDGYVTLPFADLVRRRRVGAARDAGARVRRRDGAHARGRRAGQGARRQGVRRPRPQLRGRDARRRRPWFSIVASRRLLDVANAYLQLWAKLSYVDLWYTAQQPAGDERVASQNWHVDFDDRHLLKAFVYLSDVSGDHGPFEYVRGSQAGGRNTVRPWEPMGYGRVSDDEVGQQRVAGRDRDVHRADGHAHPLQHERAPPRRASRPPGPRVLATATYCSPASLKALSNRNYDTSLETTTPSSASPSRRRGASAYSVVQSSSGRTPPRSCPVKRPFAESPRPGSVTWKLISAGTLTWLTRVGAPSEAIVTSTAMTPSLRRFCGNPRRAGVRPRLGCGPPARRRCRRR